MKIYRQEFVHDYKSYLFGYTLHALREENDLIDDLYKNGFLPYTGNINTKNNYYMARSCRIDLEKFTISSENKRVQKKISSGDINKKKLPAANYIDDEGFFNFCLEYFAKRHGENIFSKERLHLVLSFSKEVNVIKYENNNGEALAYVIETEGMDIAQYWFSFYDLNSALQSFGIWLMLDCIITAKEKKLKYYYLGTVYGEKALYKTNFKALEFWDGNSWQQNIPYLKELARRDKEYEFIDQEINI